MGSSDWAILRCKGSSTLRLARSLADAGFGTWAPVELRSHLVGRQRKRVESEFPILPEYVFAPAHHLTDLLALSHSPSLNYRVWDSEQRRMVERGHPVFSLFRLNGQFRPIADRALNSLRELEASLDLVAQRRREQERQKGPIPRFTKGDEVRVDGGFEGLVLTVAAPNVGKMVQLAHPAWMWTVEISAFKLKAIQVSQALPERAAA